MGRHHHPHTLRVAEAMFDVLAEHEGDHVPSVRLRMAIIERTHLTLPEVRGRIRPAARYLRDCGFNVTSRDGSPKHSGWRLTPAPIETVAYDNRTIGRHYSEVVRRYRSLDGAIAAYPTDRSLVEERSFLAALAIQQGLRVGKSSDEVMDQLRHRAAPPPRMTA